MFTFRVGFFITDCASLHLSPVKDKLEQGNIENGLRVITNGITQLNTGII